MSKKDQLEGVSRSIAVKSIRFRETVRFDGKESLLISLDEVKPGPLEKTLSKLPLPQRIDELSISWQDNIVVLKRGKQVVYVPMANVREMIPC